VAWGFNAHLLIRERETATTWPMGQLGNGESGVIRRPHRSRELKHGQARWSSRSCKLKQGGDGRDDEAVDDAVDKGRQPHVHGPVPVRHICGQGAEQERAGDDEVRQPLDPVEHEGEEGGRHGDKEPDEEADQERALYPA
jgi:hypothetical protein